MHGFKSFAKKEILKLSVGVTTVVGPNGCGKTNIVDAIRWVLGEQKKTCPICRRRIFNMASIINL